MKRHLPLAPPAPLAPLAPALFACAMLLVLVFTAPAPVMAEGPQAPLTRGAAAAEVPTGQASASGQVIYISLGKQRMWAHQDGKQVFAFVISSGIPTRATKQGNFRVLDKIPNAWSNVWQLSMPWWMGIYIVGRVENGIHALPINERGVRLWAGLLGHPASFGCIILNTPDAVKLYDRAQVGALVIIRN